jgi:hypothetical protein
MAKNSQIMTFGTAVEVRTGTDPSAAVDLKVRVRDTLFLFRKFSDIQAAFYLYCENEIKAAFRLFHLTVSLCL